VLRRFGYSAALLALVVGCVEGLAALGSLLLARQVLLYRPSGLEKWPRYLAERDPALGWPGTRSLGHEELDASGSRRVPAFPDPRAPSCAALFGDSFTWGAEVPPEQAYGNVLAQKLGCRVSNFGVEGYGTDQAVLRYERLAPTAPFVVLGYYADNIVRNVNQERAFLTNEPFGLKPRFVLEGDRLALVPLPAIGLADYAHLDERAQALLPHDYFRPGGPAGVTAMRFPFTLSVLRTLRHYRIRAALRGEASYAAFYEPSHPSRALAVTAAIMERFVSGARARGQTPLLLLIPDVKDLERLRAGRPITYQPLVDRLVARQLPVVSAAEPLLKSLGAEPPCALYTRCSGGHFRPDGYRLLAELVEAAFRGAGNAAEGARGR
jgi:hypothetical protein